MGRQQILSVSKAEQQQHGLGPERGGIMDDKTRIEIEAAVFRGLIAHLRRRTDAQNIDLTNLAGFCRNCLARWVRATAADRGEEMSYEAARETVYGMPYETWKQKYQTEATPEQKQRFEDTKPLHAVIEGGR